MGVPSIDKVEKARSFYIQYFNLVEIIFCAAIFLPWIRFEQILFVVAVFHLMKHDSTMKILMVFVYRGHP
jgi:hypothetical protein